MRYEIVKNEIDLDILKERKKIAEQYMLEAYHKYNKWVLGAVAYHNFKTKINEGTEYSLVYCCKNCGAEIFGQFQETPSFNHVKERFEYYKKEYLNSSYYKPNRNDECLDSLNKVLSYLYELSELQLSHKQRIDKEYQSLANMKYCPICGAQLSKEKGFFMPDIMLSGLRMLEYKEQFGYKGSSIENKFENLSAIRETAERELAKEAVATYVQNCNIPVVSSISNHTQEIKHDNENLKSYIHHLICLENNIYLLEQQLSSLYYIRPRIKRVAVLSDYQPVFSTNLKLKELHLAYQNALKEISAAESYQPDILPPRKPAEPVFDKPNLFNKKKVLTKNEAMAQKYKEELEAYLKELGDYQEEKERLVVANIEAAKKKADEAKAAVEEAERDKDRRLMELRNQSIPAKTMKTLLDQEITETEQLLKTTYKARNELYAYEVIFGKYRNVVALSSFYEYLVSGRCVSLEGADGAYNIYESEIRANRVIAQLDSVISSLDNINENQYMMYQEMNRINASLDHMNRTMDQALLSLNKLEVNTAHISENSDIIAHNTALTACYSKINAELTNALGYMVAFK